MKKQFNVGEHDMILRIIFGIMLFILFWYQLLGHISLDFPIWLNWILLIASVFLLITGSSRICPIFHLLKIKTNK